MGNCCSKSKLETEEANVADTDVNSALEKSEGNNILVNVAPISQEVGHIDDGGTYPENVNEPKRGDEQIIAEPTEQVQKPATADGYPTMVAIGPGTQGKTQNTLLPVSSDRYSSMAVSNESREQDYVIDDRRGQEYVINDTREQDYVIHDTREQETRPVVSGGNSGTIDYREQETYPVITNGYNMTHNDNVMSGTMEQALPVVQYGGRQTMANAYMPHEITEQEQEEITEQALLAGKTVRNTNTAAYSQNTLPSGISGRYSTMVPNGYVEAGTMQASGYIDEGVAFDEMPTRTDYEKAGIIFQGNIKQHGCKEVGVIFEGRCYQKRVFDENLGQYVYIAD